LGNSGRHSGWGNSPPSSRRSRAARTRVTTGLRAGCSTTSRPIRSDWAICPISSSLPGIIRLLEAPNVKMLTTGWGCPKIRIRGFLDSPFFDRAGTVQSFPHFAIAPAIQPQIPGAGLQFLLFGFAGIGQSGVQPTRAASVAPWNTPRVGFDLSFGRWPKGEVCAMRDEHVPYVIWH
jgi:hypothetical protein